MPDQLLTDISFVPLVFSRNRLLHTIEAADPEMTSRVGLAYSLDIQVPTFPQSLAFESLHQSRGKEAPVQSQGNTSSFSGALFEYNRRNGKLDGLLTYQKPYWKQNKMSTVVSQTTPFKLREVVTGGTPAVNLDATLPTKWCIKAGLSDEDFIIWQDSFWNVNQAQKRQFLTWQPNEKVIGKTQEEYLSFLINFFPRPSKVCLRIEAYKADKTSTVFTKGNLENVAMNMIVLCPVGAEALGLGDDVVKYDVWLSDEQNRRFSEVRTYIIDPQFRPNERHILFSNSLGGFDTLRLIGKGSETLKVTQTFAQRDNQQKSIDWLEMVAINTEGHRELTISTGWFDRNAKKYLRYLDELMLSDEMYFITEKGHLPIRRNTNELIDTEDNTDVIARSFSFMLDKVIQNYSDAPGTGATQARATIWEGLDFSHILDGFGKRTGRMKPARLRKVYEDDRSIFKPLTMKPNVEGDADYLPYLINPNITPGSSPYPNTAIIRSGTFIRLNCSMGKVGGYATITIPAGKYGSESPGEAQQLAELEYTTTNTQEYANLFGDCVLNPYDYTYATPVGYAHFRQTGFVGGDGVSKDDRNGIGKGNMWFLQNQVGQTDVYPQGYWGFNLPTNYLTNRGWRFILYGANFGLKVYVNGNLIYNVAQVPTADNYADIEIPHAQIPSGSRVYLVKISY
ncbi:DUF5977 domain-containing protein [Arcicella aquatica]|uniref:DUF5977 domain-containing protein n=1 Tax=Arcicella aquatica TaxID=217141 RepID=A0ABU5QRS8_9BACT|nr:DUF5977 domain-containing protein [Arcicella aquatica]MEA5259465.1 DUF5977 domain-containing protein [Arcicella aquatica]